MMPKTIHSDEPGSRAPGPVPSSNPASSHNPSVQQAPNVGSPEDAAALPSDPDVPQAQLQELHSEYEKLSARVIKCDVCGKRWAPCLQMCTTCRVVTCVNCHNNGLYHRYHNLANLGLDWSYPQVITRRRKHLRSDKAESAHSSAKKAKIATTPPDRGNDDNYVPDGSVSQVDSKMPMALFSSFQIEAAGREGTSGSSNALIRGNEQGK